MPDTPDNRPFIALMQQMASGDYASAPVPPRCDVALAAIAQATAALTAAKSAIEDYEPDNAPRVADILALLSDLASDVRGNAAKREDRA